MSVQVETQHYAVAMMMQPISVGLDACMAHVSQMRRVGTPPMNAVAFALVAQRSVQYTSGIADMYGWYGIGKKERYARYSFTSEYCCSFALRFGRSLILLGSLLCQVAVLSLHALLSFFGHLMMFWLGFLVFAA